MLYMSATIGMGWIIKNKQDVEFLREIFDSTGEFFENVNYSLLLSEWTDYKVTGKRSTLRVQVLKYTDKSTEDIEKYLTKMKEDLKEEMPEKDIMRMRDILNNDEVVYGHFLVNAETLMDV